MKQIDVTISKGGHYKDKDIYVAPALTITVWSGDGNDYVTFSLRSITPEMLRQMADDLTIAQANFDNLKGVA